ncbi:MAG: type II secretion system protein GspG [Candidatus Hydrogenedentes bacterium]|nr:type II secretion system protein GspG [Candidatus Hydrogenedentota bacterium]
MKNNGGFTLIELILVTVIIGILAGMVVTTFGGRAHEAKVNAAKGDISSYSNAIDLYALDHNDVYPQSLDQLSGGQRNYVRELRPDPWGNPYNYTGPTDPQKADYRVWSSGPDGVPGSVDDVDSNTTTATQE